MLDENRKVYLAQDQQHGFSSDSPHNTGIMVIGSAGPTPEQRTIVIAGQPRGGTTMVAECLSTLGLPLGVPQPPPPELYNFEDRDFLELLHMEHPGDIDLPRLQGLVHLRNDAHPIWGFKLPMAINSLEVLERELRNPHFILVFRDPIAVASREVITVGMEAMYALRRSLLLQQRMVDFAESSSAPCMLLSYEKALQFPTIVVDLVANWCGWDTSEEQRKQAYATIEANRPNYVSAVAKVRGMKEVPDRPVPGEDPA